MHEIILIIFFGLVDFAYTYNYTILHFPLKNLCLEILFKFYKFILNNDWFYVIMIVNVKYKSIIGN